MGVWHLYCGYNQSILSYVDRVWQIKRQTLQKHYFTLPSLIFICLMLSMIAQSDGAVEYTDYFSAEG